MLHQACARFPRQVKSGTVRVLYVKQVNPAQALEVVIESAMICHKSIEFMLTCVTEWCVTNIVSKGYGFC